MNNAYEKRYVGRWMSTRVEAVAPETPLGDAFETMMNHRIRHLPVLEGETLVGILSNRDVTRLALKDGEPTQVEISGEAKVRDVMTVKRLHTANPRDTVREAAEVVCREKISALPVVEGTRLVGIVTSEDLLWAFLEGTTEEELDYPD